jgi:predicted glycosyltransferase
MTFADYLDDLPSYIAAADLSISMGGYNTICEVLSAGVPARAVPRIFPRKEQYMRAQLLALRGLLRVILPNFLRPDYLAAVRAALESPRPRARQINLHGGERAAVFFSSLLRRRNHAEIRLCARSGT